ncbi:MAG TPA: group II intron reverse transcriptase/maturase, partial [Chloroflexi bacterium]|nr:group II intron reverse transcriptase/maturase [Chloroflexota bacterium]
REAQAAHTQAARALAELGLALHPAKTRVVHFDTGFKFLGRFFLRGEVHTL